MKHFAPPPRGAASRGAGSPASWRISGTPFGRYREIAAVLLRHGFGDVVAHARLEHQADGPVSRAQRFRRALEDLGPTFVKFGQALSVRGDLVPEVLVQELTHLQDDVAPLAPGVAEAEIEQAFGRPLPRLYASFDPLPLAAGSIAQVHRATLPTGEAVAVKVRRPGIGPLIESDLAVLAHLARIAERYLPDADLYGPGELVAEFARSIRREQDFAREGRVIERFARAFAGNPWLRVPRVFWPATSPRVLTLEFIDGVKVSVIDRDRAGGLDPSVVAERGARAMLEQIFVHGLFHGDPHPGNVLVLPDNVICLLDFGIVGRLDADTRARLRRFVTALAGGATDDVVRHLVALATPRAPIQLAELRKDVDELIDSYADTSLRDVAVGDAVRRVLATMSRHRLTFSADLMLLVKALATMEGVGRRLDPDFQMLAVAGRFAGELGAQQLAPEALAAQGVRRARSAAARLRTLYTDAAGLLDKARNDRLSIRFVHSNLERFVLEMDRASNRLSFAIVIAALLVASSMVIQTGITPRAFGYPIIGVAGFVAAAVLGLGLIVGVIRSGRL